MQMYWHVIIFLFFATGARAMDLEMVTVKSKKVPVELQIKNWPIELQVKVAENIIDLLMHEHENAKECIDHKKCERWNLSKLLLKIEYAQEFHQLQKICENKICGKKFSAQELFGLQRKHQDIFIRLAHPSMAQQCIGYTIETDDCRELFGIKNNIWRGMELKILDGSKVGHFIFGLCLFGCVVPSLVVCLSKAIDTGCALAMNINCDLPQEVIMSMTNICGMGFAGVMIILFLHEYILPKSVKV